MIRKPIKRNEHIRKLSQEHHFCLLFCWKVRQGVKKEIAPDRIWRYVQYFWHGHLRPHFKSEEKILFAPLRDTRLNGLSANTSRLINLFQKWNGNQRLSGESHWLNLPQWWTRTCDTKKDNYFRTWKET